MIEHKLCPVCMGDMILIVDPWTLRRYWQCILCGHIENIYNDWMGFL